MVTTCYGDILPKRGHILDLMASWDSHLPPRFEQVTGLGLNQQELEYNPRLSNRLIFDVNRSDQLPFDDDTFDGVVCTVSVQYMTRPTETFSEIGRSLKKGAPFIVAFSNRMFPSKAVLAWRSSDDQCHIRLVKHYFSQTHAFGQVSVQVFEPQSGDPLYVLWACKQS
jgi:ubiquinone/menaquinone biosynthesis C-methylase UbiE